MPTLASTLHSSRSTLRIRAEETSGRAEPVLATATSRLTWLAGQLSVALAGSGLALVASGLGEGVAYGMTVPDASRVPRLIGVALAYLPAVWLIIAVTVLVLGWLPRPAAAVAWVVVAYCAVVTLFADSFDLPGWTRRASRSPTPRECRWTTSSSRRCSASACSPQPSQPPVTPGCAAATSAPDIAPSPTPCTDPPGATQMSRRA